jgi:PAS domain S-box-containing protein
MKDNEQTTIQLREELQALRERNAELEAAAARFRSLVEQSTDFISCHSPDGVYRYASPACRRLLGYEPEELVGHSAYDFFHPDDLAAIAASHATILEQPEVFTVSYRIRRRDGTYLWFETTSHTIRDEHTGAVTEIQAASRDITERKQAEQELHGHRDHLEELVKKRVAELAAERHLLRVLIDNMPDLILVKDTASRFLAVNPALAHLMGARAPDELLGKTDFDFYPHEIAQHYYALEQEFLHTGRPLVNQEELHRDPDTGEDRWFLATKIPFRDQQGVVHGLVGISRDITEHKQLEEELRRHRDHLEELVNGRTVELIAANARLRQSEEKYRRLIETTDTGFVIVDPEGNVLDANAEYVNLTGHATPEDIIGHNVLEWTAKQTDEQNRAALKQCIAQGFVRNLEIEYSDLTGRITPIEINATVVETRTGVQILSLCRDITERKRVEAEIRTLNAELEQRVRERTAKLETVNKELQSFAYVVSHDLKAPLRAIAKLAQWLVEDYAGAFDAKGNEMVDLLVGRVKRMDNLIDGILEYSRIGRIVGQHETIDLNRLLPDVLDLLSPPSSIRIAIAAELPPIIGDKTRIQQIFANLIGNAVKFMDKPQGEITICCLDDGPFWRFSVTDNGPGIDPKYHDKIFQIFQTLKPRDELESTGIGLSIVKKIVEFYGGRIWVESTLGQGSSFVFTYPSIKK